MWLSGDQQGCRAGYCCWHPEQPERGTPAPGETSHVSVHSPPFCSFLDFLLPFLYYFLLPSLSFPKPQDLSLQLQQPY